MFIEDVQRWLSSPPTAEAEPVPSLPEGFDLDGRWEVVWKALEEMEGGGYLNVQRWRKAHAAWTAPGRLELWVAVFWRSMSAGIGRRLTEEQRLVALDDALYSAVRLTRVGQGERSATVNLELQRIERAATEATEPGRMAAPADDVVAWAFENGLATTSGLPTPTGRILTELRGRDSVEFALAIGVELSVGPDDPWRLSADGLAAIAEEEQAYDESGEVEWSAFAWEAMLRLTEIGIATRERHPESGYDRIVLNPDARDLVLRVATEPDSRFRALARALLDVERGRLSAEATGRGGPDLSDMSYARSVAHEIRNLTLPLSTGLNALWEELGQDQPDHERRQKLRDRITRSLDRLNEFATEAVKLSAAVAEEEIALVEVVSEAIKATESERNGRISVQTTGIETRRILGTRRDWSTAFINLLRNAAQSRAGKGTVVISTLIDDAGGLHIYVDDDGPGVPEELRERVFDFGHSTRGGSGLGLADARRTAQRSGGTLVCEAAPQGGARFHFTLPRRSTA